MHSSQTAGSDDLDAQIQRATAALLRPECAIKGISDYEAQLSENSAFLQKPFRFATLLEQLKLIRRKA